MEKSPTHWLPEALSEAEALLIPSSNLPARLNCRFRLPLTMTRPCRDFLSRLLGRHQHDMEGELPGSLTKVFHGLSLSVFLSVCVFIHPSPNT